MVRYPPSDSCEKLKDGLTALNYLEVSDREEIADVEEVSNNRVDTNCCLAYWNLCLTVIKNVKFLAERFLTVLQSCFFLCFSVFFFHILQNTLNFEQSSETHKRDTRHQDLYTLNMYRVSHKKDT